jgi:hypothetical protein
MMDDWERQAVLLRLIDALNDAGSWTGETHVQKCAYVLEEGLDVPLELDFILYKHGPYSFDLADLFGELRGKLLISYERMPAPYGPKLIVSPSGTALVQRFPRTVRKFRDQISFVCQTLGSKNVKQLERVATALYATRRFNGSVDERAEKIVQLKPHVAPADARAAVVELDRLLAEAKHK